MIRLIDKPLKYTKGKLVEDVNGALRENTIAYSILSAHNVSGDVNNLKIRFDALASHDITYVGIIQTARASGLKEFPIPYVLTNCHNSLCAVGGTINEDDHLFGLSAAKKYGGIYVPPHLAVIHTYMREMMSGCGKMILGSDSHTRYGALGTMAVGEGGPELVKQLLSRTYDIKYPQVIAVYLTGKVNHGVGAQDVALAIIKAVFKNGFVKNKVMEFIGDGIEHLPIEYRNGIDVMTTETTCLSSVWRTDGEVKKYFVKRGRADAYKKLEPEENALYDGAVIVDLSKIEPMIALPFHPSNVYTIKELLSNPYDILHDCEVSGNKLLNNKKVEFKLTDKIVNGKIKTEQGVIAGCAGGTYDNIVTASKILSGGSTGNGEFALDVYPSSQPVYLELVKNGSAERLMSAGAILKTAFCGPCFGAGDVPANNSLSIRHTTRNFESREGSKPADRQIASVALMDARSIAATALNGGYLTSAADVDYDDTIEEFNFDGGIYSKRVYNGYKSASDTDLRFGPNIADWPSMPPLRKNLLLKVASAIYDDVTTTDELIPSGETSSYRSNPLKLSEFALSRKDPEYVGRAKGIKTLSDKVLSGEVPEELKDIFKQYGLSTDDTLVASAVYAKKPGDGSAREQAASCQRVLGGGANLAVEYATKRYRSNLINWGMLPLLTDYRFKLNDCVLIKDVVDNLDKAEYEAIVIRDGKSETVKLKTDALTKDEQSIIKRGCLINFYSSED